MYSIDISKLEKAVNGKIIHKGKHNTVSGVVIDSRLVKEGDVFFALDGTALDGHDFVKKADEKGAACCIVKRFTEQTECFQIQVEDTLKALYDMALSYKNEFDIPFVALTGSAGKTSTKDMVAGVLSKKYNTMKTIGNYNSTTGVPLTLFNLKKENEIAVIEMGMNHKGEIEKISSLVKPDYAMITNVGVTHIENLGSKENIFKAKTEITKGLKKGATLVVNGDNEFFRDYKNDDFKVVKIGIENGDFKAYDLKFDRKGVSFKVSWQGEEYSFNVNIPANYSVYNGLFAIYTGFHFGLDYEQIKQGILEFVPSNNRMRIEKLKDFTIIDDTYNSNPDALKEALSLLSNISGNNRKVAVLGDMFELGKESEREHYGCGRFLKEKNIDLLLALGKDSLHIVRGAVESGFDEERAVYFKSKEELIKNIKSYLSKGDYILFKASRGMAFEDIVKAVKDGGKN